MEKQFGLKAFCRRRTLSDQVSSLARVSLKKNKSWLSIADDDGESLMNVVMGKCGERRQQPHVITVMLTFLLAYVYLGGSWSCGLIRASRRYDWSYQACICSRLDIQEQSANRLRGKLPSSLHRKSESPTKPKWNVNWKSDSVNCDIQTRAIGGGLNWNIAWNPVVDDQEWLAFE